MFGYGLKGSREAKVNVALKEIDMKGNICGEFVEFSVKQVYENKGKDNVDAAYIFPIPDTAVLTGFEATLGGRTIKAIVEDKKEAIKVYNESLERGLNALSLEEVDPNVFQISIGEILPNETVKIKVSYMDQLFYEDNALKLTVPSILAPRQMGDEIEIMDSESAEEYKLSLNLLVEPLGKLRIQSPTHKINVEWEEEINMARVSLKDEMATLNKDLVLILTEDNIEEASGMAYRYVEEDEEKAILYLRLMPELERSDDEKPNNYVFVLDISDSMNGEKLTGAKNALQLCIRNLSEGDSFNIIAFESRLHYFSNTGNVIFNDETLRSASNWIDSLKAYGGSEIFKALKVALSEQNNFGHNTILLFTDDIIENEKEVLDYVKNNIGNNRIFTFGIDTYANSYVINKLAELGFGKSEFIYPEERIDDVVLRQFNRIESPQVDITEISFGNVKVERTFPRTIDYIYDREPFSIFAKVAGNIEGTITVKGKVRDKEYLKTVDLDSLDLSENANLIQKIWSRKRIESIVERLKGERGETAEAMRKKIIEISKESGIISPETSYLMIESIDEPVLGMTINRILPLRVSEETIKNMSDANFLESANFVYKSTKKDTPAVPRAAAKNDNELLDIRYPRENILRILAKNQYADGSFANYSETRMKNTIKTTALAVIAFTAGREDINVYINQVTKSVRFMLKALRENKGIFDERLYLLTSIALRTSIDKGVIKGSLEEQAKKELESIKSVLGGKGLEELSAITEYNNRINIRKMASLIFNVSKIKGAIEEKIIIDEEKESIYSLAKLGILKSI